MNEEAELSGAPSPALRIVSLVPNTAAWLRHMGIASEAPKVAVYWSAADGGPVWHDGGEPHGLGVLTFTAWRKAHHAELRGLELGAPRRATRDWLLLDRTVKTLYGGPAGIIAAMLHGEGAPAEGAGAV